MSGHSKWHKIKHKKALADSKKSKLFGQLSRDIKSAIRAKGDDPATNVRLREAIDRARRANVPQSNIDRLLATDTDATSEALYEGYGPAGVAFLIVTETDNTNRTVAEVRSIVRKHGGTLGRAGSVLWKFSPHYIVEVDVGDCDHETFELTLIEAGANDIVWYENTATIIATPQLRTEIEQVVATLAVTTTSAQIGYVAPADQRVSLTDDDAETYQHLVVELEDHPDVIAVFTDVVH